MEDGLLCLSCREAIVRLLAIDGSEQAKKNEAVNKPLDVGDYLETRRNTRKAGS